MAILGKRWTCPDCGRQHGYAHCFKLECQCGNFVEAITLFEWFDTVKHELLTEDMLELFYKIYKQKQNPPTC